MKYDPELVSRYLWASEISNREKKEKVAQQLARLVRDGETIGFGSGSTSYLAILAISRRMKEKRLHCTAIPTSHETALACAALDIPTTSILNARPDWSFDGADEVDPSLNLIKGRGGAMFKEKLIMASAPKTYILIDSSKRVDTLGRKFPVPIEFHPLSLFHVEKELVALGATEACLRLASKKDGPVITECGNFIFDTRFADIGPDLERKIKSITGVIESGLFTGYPVEILCSD